MVETSLVHRHPLIILGEQWEEYSIQYRIREKFRQPQIPLYCRNIGGINFCQCGKGRHILYVIINTGQKIHVIKISPMRADGKIGENFLLVKISAYGILYPTYVHKG